MSIPIIEEELIELFFYAVEIIPHNLSGFFGVQTLQKLLARKGKRREKKKKSWMVIRVTAHGVGRPFPAINWPARVRIEWDLIFGPFFNDSFPVQSSPGESELFMKVNPGDGICCLRGRDVE